MVVSISQGQRGYDEIMESGESITEAVRSALASRPSRPQDIAAERLALTYAELLDTYPDQIPKVGPALLAVLDALLLTPRAATRTGKGQVTDEQQASPLDELRARRQRRAR